MVAGLGAAPRVSRRMFTAADDIVSSPCVRPRAPRLLVHKELDRPAGSLAAWRSENLREVSAGRTMLSRLAFVLAVISMLALGNAWFGFGGGAEPAKKGDTPAAAPKVMPEGDDDDDDDEASDAAAAGDDDDDDEEDDDDDDDIPTSGRGPGKFEAAGDDDLGDDDDVTDDDAQEIPGEDGEEDDDDDDESQGELRRRRLLRGAAAAGN